MFDSQLIMNYLKGTRKDGERGFYIDHHCLITVSHKGFDPFEIPYA